MKLMKCSDCSGYTLKGKCPKCGIKTAAPHPPKYSPVDAYGKYRRIMKKEAGII